MIGGIALSYVLYRFIPSLIFSAIPIIIVLTFSAALAFYRVNNRPFINVLESAFRYSVGSKLYLWKKDDKKQAAEIAKQMKAKATEAEKGKGNRWRAGTTIRQSDCTKGVAEQTERFSMESGYTRENQ